MMPRYWKNDLDAIEQQVNTLSKGKMSVIGQSAGGRNIYMVEYGKQSDYERKANFNSACGANYLGAYKNLDSQTPCIFIVGGVHGNEHEGITGILNLISILETGGDLAGTMIDGFENIQEDFHLVLIPCLNPDGRARVPTEGFVGASVEDHLYYAQGTWKDGSLCKWPDCKKIHPIKDHVEFLGGYFNDDGINLMHDNFFFPMAKETISLMKTAEKFAADFILLLHGGSNCTNYLTPADYIPGYKKDEVMQLASKVKEACNRSGLEFQAVMRKEKDKAPPHPFNLTSALYHICGGTAALYESNQGIEDLENALDFDRIYLHHIILFREIFNFYRK